MHTKQRKFQQPKCLHVITCLLFSCLVLVLEWQATVATPIIATSATAANNINSTATSANRRLRNHEKPTKVVGGGGGGYSTDSASGASLRRNRVLGGFEGGTRSSSPCEHKSLSELIKTSPVILKALGAHIFNHDDDEDLRILHNSNDALLLKWQNEQNKVLTSLKTTHTLTSSSSATSTATKSTEKTRQQKQHQKQQQTFSDAATNRAAMLASMNADAILITLTPETIYKGASLLKMTPNAAEHATSHSSGTSSSSTSGNNMASGSGSSGSSTFDSNNGNSANSGATGSGSNSGTINSSEASYLYEG